MASPKEPDVEHYVDPVVEFYKKKVDRAALRENLKLTVEQRLQKLQQRIDDDVRAAADRLRPVQRASIVREEAAAYGNDPVIEAYKKDVDRTLLRENLKLTPSQRVEKLQAFTRAFASIRGVARRTR